MRIKRIEVLIGYAAALLIITVLPVSVYSDDRPSPPPPSGEHDTSEVTVVGGEILHKEIGFAPKVKLLEPLQLSPKAKILRIEKKEPERRRIKIKQPRKKSEVFDGPMELLPPEGINTKYNCQVINFDATNDMPICAFEKRTLYCIKAPCPQPEPQWINYPNVETACRRGNKIIEYVMGECRKVPKN